MVTYLKKLVHLVKLNRFVGTSKIISKRAPKQDNILKYKD
jgi:hypothetical protein